MISCRCCIVLLCLPCWYVVHLFVYYVIPFVGYLCAPLLVWFGYSVCPFIVLLFCYLIRFIFDSFIVLLRCSIAMLLIGSFVPLFLYQSICYDGTRLFSCAVILLFVYHDVRPVRCSVIHVFCYYYMCCYFII